MVSFFLPLVLLPLVQFSNQKQKFLPMVHSCLWCCNTRPCNNESDWLIPGENTHPTIPGDSFKCTIPRSALPLPPAPPPPPTLPVLLKRIMTVVHRVGSVSIGGQHITKFRFAIGIVVTAEEGLGTGVLVDRLDTTVTRYKMEICPDKTGVTTHNPDDFHKITGQRIEIVENFKYMGSIISNE